MKRLLAILFSLAVPAAFGQSVVNFAMTNRLTNLPDTNFFRIFSINDPVMAHGGIQTKGPAKLIYPDTNGLASVTLLGGWYQMTNFALGQGILFLVPGDTNSYNVNDIAVSGFSTYQVTGVRKITSNDGSVTVSPTNGVGVIDLATTGVGGGGIFTRAGTNASAYTNSNVVTLSGVTDTNVVNALVAANRIDVSAGTNATVLTNGLLRTVSGQTDTNVVGILATNATEGIIPFVPQPGMADWYFWNDGTNYWGQNRATSALVSSNDFGALLQYAIDTASSVGELSFHVASSSKNGGLQIYFITNTVVVKQTLRLSGEGKSQTLIAPATTNAYALFQLGDNTHSIESGRFENILFHGSAPPMTNATAIYQSNALEVQVYQCVFDGFQCCVMNAAGGADNSFSQFQNCIFDQAVGPSSTSILLAAKTGIPLQIADCLIESCYFYSQGDMIVCSNDFQNLQIHDCRFLNTSPGSPYGIRIEGGSQFSIVGNNFNGFTSVTPILIRGRSGSTNVSGLIGFNVAAFSDTNQIAAIGANVSGVSLIGNTTSGTNTTLVSSGGASFATVTNTSVAGATALAADANGKIIPGSGGAATNVINVAVNTNAVAVTNGLLVTISGVTDTNVVNILATNAAAYQALIATQALSSTAFTPSNVFQIRTNGINYGNAFSSIGTAAQSEQFGANATATANQATAVGNQAAASGVSSTAIGGSSLASSNNATALGELSTASGRASLALGFNSTALHTNSTALGEGSATTQDHQVMLGTSSEYVYAPGQVSVAGQTNRSLTASSVTGTDSNKDAVSIANGGANTLLHGTTPPAYSSVVISDIGNAGSSPGQVITATASGAAWSNAPAGSGSGLPGTNQIIAYGSSAGTNAIGQFGNTTMISNNVGQIQFIPGGAAGSSISVGNSINALISLGGANDLTLEVGGTNALSATNTGNGLAIHGYAPFDLSFGNGYYGLVPSGGETNAAGSRVAYLSDISGTGAPWATVVSSGNGVTTVVTNSASGTNNYTVSAIGLPQGTSVTNLTVWANGQPALTITGGIDDTNPTSHFSLYYTNGALTLWSNGVVIALIATNQTILYGTLTNPIITSGAVSASTITNTGLLSAGVVGTDSNGKLIVGTAPSGLPGTNTLIAVTDQYRTNGYYATANSHYFSNAVGFVLLSADNIISSNAATKNFSVLSNASLTLNAGAMAGALTLRDSASNAVFAASNYVFWTSNYNWICTNGTVTVTNTSAANNYVQVSGSNVTASGIASAYLHQGPSQWNTNADVWQTANYNVVANDTFVLLAANRTFTMPSPSAAQVPGHVFWLQCSGSGTNAINPNGSETFNGNMGTALSKLTNTAAGKATLLWSNGTNWWYVQL